MTKGEQIRVKVIIHDYQTWEIAKGKKEGSAPTKVVYTKNQGKKVERGVIGEATRKEKRKGHEDTPLGGELRDSEGTAWK